MHLTPVLTLPDAIPALLCLPGTPLSLALRVAVEQLVHEVDKGRCAQKHTARADGVVVALADAVSCNTTNSTVVARLQHGSSYHVIVTAVSGAGMTTRAFSNSFIADLYGVVDVRYLSFEDPGRSSRHRRQACVHTLCTLLGILGMGV